MILDKIKKYYIHAICLFILSMYFIAVLVINFSGNPAYYITDMYSDMTYAAEVWTHKGIFPDGWVFGNQLYVVATPVLASVFYGLSHNHSIAMGIASTIMGISVLLSFSYMLKPVFPSFRERLIGMVAFMSLVLACGSPIYSTNGWQLFFTMCSYYACYAITAFLAFGCYLRSDRAWSFRSVSMLLLTCVLSFGTGIQSLRQTAIMVCPLIAVALLRMIRRLVRKENVADKALLITGLITVSNLSGVLCSKISDIEQVQLLGNISMTDLSKAFSNVLPSLSRAVSLFGPAADNTVVILTVISVLLFVYVIYRLYAAKNHNGILCLVLLSMGVAAILFVDILTTMYVRNIYYFLLFPLIAFVIVTLHSCAGKVMYHLIVILLVVSSVSTYTKQLSPVVQQPAPETAYEEVVSYLEENNITTIFSGWNRGEKISIASQWNIKAGFWDSYRTPFVPVNYLCDPAVFNADPAHSAYIFFGSKEASVAAEKARNMNANFTLLKHFSESNIYIYTSTANLMKLSASNGS